MELNQFFKGIRMNQEAVRKVSELSISEEEYQKNKLLFQTDKELFYKEVLKEMDFRIHFLYYFSRMACDDFECLREKFGSEQIYWDTFSDLTLWCENCIRDYGQYGIQEYRWFHRHIEGKIRRLGRLQFEELDVEWKEIEEDAGIQGKVPVINVHIPQGEKLELSAAKLSFERAFRVWGKQIPYICDSWLLYPELKEILPADSNILKFQCLFKVTRVESEGREAERRIFNRVSDEPSDYPETTLLQRRAKEYLLKGKRLGSGVGVLKVEAVATDNK